MIDRKRRTKAPSAAAVAATVSFYMTAEEITGLDQHRRGLIERLGVALPTDASLYPADATDMSEDRDDSMRFQGLSPGHKGREITLRDVAAELGVSLPRARQIETRALEKARSWCKSHGIELSDLIVERPDPAFLYSEDPEG